MPPKVDDKALQWVEITDFTPGIVSNTQLQAAASSGVGNTGPVPMTKLGQAQNAEACIALPNGGLGPLPGLNAHIAPPASTVPISGYYNIVNGLFVTGPIAQGVAGGPADSVIVGVEAIKNDGSERDFYLFDTLRLYGGAVAYQRTIVHEGVTTNSVPQFNTMTGGMTLATGSGLPQIPFWLLSYWFLAGTVNSTYGGSPQQWLYPDPNIDATTPLVWTSPSSNYPAYALTHESRLVLMQKSLFHWTSSTYYHAVCEYFNYTDPPLTTTLGTQNETFVPENPTGIEAWGSISASELFCVKNNGGGFVLTGDLNTPTVTRLPGVQSTYGLVSRVAQTPIGLVYLSNNHGAWLWNGGNTSQKISENIDDNFYAVSFAQSGGSLPVSSVYDGPTADVCTWGDWIIFSNDWLYDIQTGGWWRLSSAGGSANPHVWYQTGSNGDILYASRVIPTSNAMVDLFQRSTPATSFTWESAPIRVPTVTKDRQLIIREIVIRAQGTGTVYVAVNGSTQTNPSSLAFTNSAAPEIGRMTVGKSGGGALIDESIEISITSNGSVASPVYPAPIVYSIAIGYEESSALVPGTPAT